MSASSPAPIKTPLLNDKVYDYLKRTATVALPAVGALYFALAQLWHLPAAEQVVGTVAALNVFVGVLVGLSTKSYNSSGAKYVGDLVGRVVPTEDGTKLVYTLELNDNPQSLESMSEATFRVKSI